MVILITSCEMEKVLNFFTTNAAWRVIKIRAGGVVVETELFGPFLLTRLHWQLIDFTGDQGSVVSVLN